MAAAPDPVSGLTTIGYVELPDLLAPAHCEHLAQYLLLQLENGRLAPDPTVAGSVSTYGDPVFDALLGLLDPVISDLAGEPLVPTYSYARLYRSGNELLQHRDRAACEVSCTVTLGGDTADRWPLHLTDEDGNEVEVFLPVGSGLAYRGCDLEHWREQFAGNWHAQLFLHWVRSEGSRAGERFDRRPGLGLAPVPPT